MSTPEPGNTSAVLDINIPYVTDGGVSIRVGDVVVYHDAAGDFPAMIVALNVATKTITVQEFNLSAPVAPLTGVSQGNSTGQWEPFQAKF